MNEFEEELKVPFLNKEDDKESEHHGPDDFFEDHNYTI